MSRYVIASPAEADGSVRTFDLRCNQRQIVCLLVAPTVCQHGVEHVITEFRGRNMLLTIQDFEQAILAKLLAGFILGFRNAIADNYQPVSVRKLDTPLLRR